MSDLNVVAVIKAKPGSEDVVHAALVSLVEPTRAESGCISYDLFVSAVEPATFITIEKWDSQADLETHLKSPHVSGAQSTFGEHLAEAPAVHPLIPA